MREAQKRILYPRMVPGVQLYPRSQARPRRRHTHMPLLSPIAVYRFIGLNDVAVKG